MNTARESVCLRAAAMAFERLRTIGWDGSEGTVG
jgi:hypothetical protein